jgi:hypothetical protein
MTKIFGLCPRCRSRIKINNVERLDGHKIACRDCGYAIRIRAPRASVSRSKAEDLEVIDLEDDLLLEDPQAVDDEFAVAIDEPDDLPAYRPLRRPAKKKPARQADAEQQSTFVADKGKGGGRKAKRSPLVIGLACGGGLLLLGLLVGGIILLRSGFATSAKFEPPEKYEPMKMALLPISMQKPEGWKSSAGGGVGSVRMWAKITDGGSIFIELRETEGSSAKGKMKKAIASGQEVHQIGGPSMGRLGEAPSVAATHEYHRQAMVKDFMMYKEGPSRPLETGFGEARISDFTGKEGIFSSTVKGCRASVVHREHQYSIICKCPPNQFKDVTPVFEKIIASMTPNEGPGE